MQESNDLSIALIGLWGAIGGAFFTLLGTIVTQFVTYVKDKGLAEIAAKEKDKESVLRIKVAAALKSNLEERKLR